MEEEFGSKVDRGPFAPLLGAGVGCNKKGKMGCAVLGGIWDSLL